MRRLRFSLRLLLIAPIAVAFAIHLWPQRQAGPITFDLGAVPVGTKIAHAFEVENATGRLLRVAHCSPIYKPGSLLTEEHLLPGETSHFNVGLSVQGERQPGTAIEVHCELHTDNPDCPTLRFRLVGTVADAGNTARMQNSRMNSRTLVKVFADGRYLARPR